MSNPFAALFEDVDRMSDPILADTDLSDPMFAPMESIALAPPPARSAPPPAAASAHAPPSQSAPQQSAPPQPEPRSAVHEMLLPPMPSASKPAAGRRKAIQQALVITWDKGNVPDLMELNDLLASGWRVATTAGFPTAEGARGSLLVVVEQEMPG
ncbi:hypothetical protein [Rubricoccus marinus]|uniref:DUF1737 domain-containing protein n=1 Tax=Rubricoccus marinus TaxID=716817 RepID=A0A259TYH7_9BACT|nr:hypothetical protein [Rubricoccus marinus]OZC02624.1 hypothetical protein BSZ36_06325 [Rubricoccus marinus]